MDFTLRAFTPGGYGLGVRTPAVLPYAVNLKGKRIRGTSMYRMRRPKPINFEKDFHHGNLSAGKVRLRAK